MRGEKRDIKKDQIKLLGMKNMISIENKAEGIKQQADQTLQKKDQ